MIGIVKSYSYKRRYGFITSDNQDYFFNYQDIIGKQFRKYKEGQKVNFVPMESSKGLRAEQVSIL